MNPTVRFHSAGVRVDVAGPPDDVAGAVRDVGHAMLAGPGADEDGPAAARIDVRVADDRVLLNGLDVGNRGQVGSVSAAILSAVDRLVLARTTCLTVHAAALSIAGRAVVLPGSSGAGKSTLAAAMMRAGFLLASDEAACFEPGTGLLVPHPRPLGLSARSRRLLGIAEPAGSQDQELAVAPHRFGDALRPDQRVPVAVVAIPSRRLGEPVDVVELPRPQGVSALLANCTGAGWDALDAWRLAGAITRPARVVHLGYDDPHEAAQALLLVCVTP